MGTRYPVASWLPSELSKIWKISKNMNARCSEHCWSPSELIQKLMLYSRVWYKIHQKHHFSTYKFIKLSTLNIYNSYKLRSTVETKSILMF
ncbi:hypothetical protein QL285_015359 [Trifolium repens]|nr:hypothetical protein QL285_015359 [Trifolium repens]